jgi:hypothetical protein
MLENTLNNKKDVPTIRPGWFINSKDDKSLAMASYYINYFTGGFRTASEEPVKPALSPPQQDNSPQIVSTATDDDNSPRNVLEFSSSIAELDDHDIVRKSTRVLDSENRKYKKELEELRKQLEDTKAAAALKLKPIEEKRSVKVEEEQLVAADNLFIYFTPSQKKYS